MSEGCNDEPLFRDLEVSRAIKDMSPAKLSVKDVYESLCRSRDREIEMVWKRAVFLTAFLIACFTAYGGLLAAYIDSDCPKSVPFTVISVAAIGIGFVGMLLSIIWIQMAKGSKAWYEHYENVIECFVSNYSEGLLREFASGDYRSLWWKSIQEKYDLNRPRAKQINNCLCSTAGGCFSVSKIVVVLGQLFFCIWAAIVALHGMYLFGHTGKLETQVKRFVGATLSQIEEPHSAAFENVVLVFMIAVVLILFVFFVAYAMNCRVKSGYLGKLCILRKRSMASQANGETK